MGRRLAAAVSVVLVAGMTSVGFAEPKTEEAEARSAARKLVCERLANLQREDGSWRVDPERAGEGDAALTALVCEALLRSWVQGTQQHFHEGVTWVGQQNVDRTPLADSLSLLLLLEMNRTTWRESITRCQAALVGRRIEPGGPAESLFVLRSLADAARWAQIEVPKSVWERARTDFLKAQNADGSWDVPDDVANAFPGASGKPDRFLATLTGALSLCIVRDALCRDNAGVDEDLDAAIDKTFVWIAKNPKKEYSPVEWYAIGRLGRFGGWVDFAGKPWRPAAAKALARRIADDAKMTPTDLAFALLTLSDCEIPVAVGKLRTRGDWNVCRDDMRHLTDEYLSYRFCHLRTWQTVSLDANLDDLATIPILYLSGSKALDFTDSEKKKLSDYVAKGGFILAARTGEGDAFDKSLRALVAELWPDRPFKVLDDKHYIYHVPRQLKGWKPDPPPEGLMLPGDGEPLGLVYIGDPTFARALSQGDQKTTRAFDLGCNIHFYVAKMAARWRTRPAEGE